MGFFYQNKIFFKRDCAILNYDDKIPEIFDMMYTRNIRPNGAIIIRKNDQFAGEEKQSEGNDAEAFYKN